MPDKRHEPTDDELLDLWSIGDDTKEIANYFKVEETTVANRLAVLLDVMAKQRWAS